jgi:hypothetical protein
VKHLDRPLVWTPLNLLLLPLSGVPEYWLEHPDQDEAGEQDNIRQPYNHELLEGDHTALLSPL